MEPRIIVVMQAPDTLELVRGHLVTAGFTAVEALSDPSQAAARFESEPAGDVALIDTGMPAAGDAGLLEVIREKSSHTERILIVPAGEARPDSRTLRGDVYGWLAVPSGAEELIALVRRALERKRLLDVIWTLKGPRPTAVAHPTAFRKILTRCSSMLRVLREAEVHAAGDAPVFITGERGTGKELLARAMHDAGPCAGGPFRALSAAELSPGSLAKEFCGGNTDPHAAPRRKTEGERRGRGTLFLKDIDKLPDGAQRRLLEELQGEEVSAAGSIGRPKIDARFIAAADEDLDSALVPGGLRRDFFAWIRGGWLHLPPLRERGEDVSLLIDHFLGAAGRPGAECLLEERARAMLLAYDFPGNVDEIQAVVQSAAERARGQVIAARCLPEQVRNRKAEGRTGRAGKNGPVQSLAEVEKQHILNVYRQMGCNKVRSARALALGLNTLRRKLKAYDVK